MDVRIGLVVAFVVGAAAGAGATSLRSGGGKPAPVDAGSGAAQSDDGDALRGANARLTEQLQECDRRVADLAAGSSAPAAAPTAASSADRGDGGRRRQNRGEPSREDWERMAQLGTVRVRIPCIRDTPWTPSARATDRLGLAPSDNEALKEAYAASNKRVLEQLRPLCGKVLGSPEAADKVGASGCMDAITNDARRASADNARAALTRVAEVQAGKREAPKAGAEAPPIEQLALALTNEPKAFEADLAKRLGPDEAKRLATSPDLCSDRRTLRATDDREQP